MEWGRKTKMAESSWFERLTRSVFSWFSRREVKTPLSYFFRIVGAVTLVALVALYLCEKNQRLIIFLIAMGVLLLLAVGVYIFAWMNPKHLVYGEAGYRAETKFALGTESQEMSPVEIATTPGMQNPKLISGGGGA